MVLRQVHRGVCHQGPGRRGQPAARAPGGGEAQGRGEGGEAGGWQVGRGGGAGGHGAGACVPGGPTRRLGPLQEGPRPCVWACWCPARGLPPSPAPVLLRFCQAGWNRCNLSIYLSISAGSLPVCSSISLSLSLSLHLMCSLGSVSLTVSGHVLAAPACVAGMM